jgi:hypothetical protein
MKPGMYRINILIRLESGTPLHRLSSWNQLLLGICRSSPSVDDPTGLCSTSAAFLSVAMLTSLSIPLTASLLYRVSGTKRRIVRKFKAVRITAIHLCHRQLKFVTINPHIRGPNVLPPLIAFLDQDQHDRSFTDTWDGDVRPSFPKRKTLHIDAHLGASLVQKVQILDNVSESAVPQYSDSVFR